MLRKPVIFLLLAVITTNLSLESHAAETPEFEREQEFRTRDGAFAVQSDIGSLFIVSLNNRTIDVKSTDSTIEQCKGISIDPFEDIIEGETHAKLLIDEFAGDWKMLIWGVRNMEVDNSTRIIYHTMLLIDLKKCDSTAVRLPSERAPLSHPIFLPQVLKTIGSHITFGVYFAAQQSCAPCNFDRDGSRLDTGDSQIQAEGAVPASPFHLRHLKDSYGYFYAFNSANGTAVVKLLDGSYKIDTLRYFEHHIDVVSVKISRIRNVGYCYKALDAPNIVHCERLDSRLRSVVSVMLPLDQSVRNVSLEYDEEGNSFVAVVLAAEIHVFIYDLFGELLATLDFGQLQDTDRVRGFHAYIMGKQYCLFYAIEQQTSKTDANNIIKCINTKKYIENHAN